MEYLGRKQKNNVGEATFRSRFYYLYKKGRLKEMSKYFSVEETQCHCGCGGNKVNPLLLEKLDELREMIGGPVEISCAYRCPEHNAEVGGVPNSQHVLGNAADVQTPDYDHCNTPEQLAWYAEQVGFDGIGIYEWGCHVDVRDDGQSPNAYRW